MAELIQVKLEGHPYSNGVAWFGYFRGTPTQEDLKAAIVEATNTDEVKDFDELDKPCPMEDTVAVLAGLECWFLCQYT